MSNQREVFLYYRYKSYEVNFVEVPPSSRVKHALIKMVAEHHSDKLDVGKCSLFKKNSANPLKVDTRISEIISNNSCDDYLELRVQKSSGMFSLFTFVAFISVES